MTITRRHLGHWAATAALAAPLAAPRLARAAAWPERGLRIIVPFGAGGSADVYARYLAERLREPLGQGLVIENRPGGGAIIGTDAAAKSAPDGYTLLMMSNTHTANETLITQRPYALMRDLMAVAAVNIAHHVLVVHADFPARTLQALIAQAKAKPGSIEFASSGPGTPYHIAGSVFAAMAGAELLHIPFRGSGEARTAVIAGQVPMMFDAIPTMLPHIESGRVRALATTGPKRDRLLPEVPSVAEAALPGYEASIWLGLMAPAGTPPAIVERLNTAVNRILQDPGTVAELAKQGSEPMPMSVAEFDAFLREDIKKQAEFIRMAKIEPQ